MAGGTLFVSRAVNLHTEDKQELERLGFRDVAVTAIEKDGLNNLIDELKPRLLMMNSRFYEIATPYMMGEILKLFPKLNTAAVSLDDYPLNRAAYFLFHGVKSYADKWEGMEEFCKGMKLIRDGEQYISPMLYKVIKRINVWPDVNNKMTKRLLECLLMLCCGYRVQRMCDKLHLGRSTVENYLHRLYEIFSVEGREEMVALAWRLHLVNDDDIKFYDDRVLDFTLPDWAKQKIEIDRRMVS